MWWINNYFWLVTSLKRFLNKWKCLVMIVSFGWEDKNPNRKVNICDDMQQLLCSLGA